MKTNYITIIIFKKIRFFSTALLVVFVSVISAQNLVETTVFADDYNRTVLTGGIPETTYTILKQAGSGDEAADPSTTSTVNVLRIPNRKGTGFWGRSGVFGDLSVYSNPFTSKLSTTDVDSIVWTFNMRQNYNSTLSGFNDAQNGVGAILLSDTADYASSTGYAVIYGETAVGKKYRLVKFAEGVDLSANFTTIALGDVSPTDGRDYMSFRVVFIKSTSTWKLSGRFDGPNTGGAFADPTQGTFDYTVSGVNNDLINTEMANFGFFQNYSGNIDKIMWIDNYLVRTYHLDTGVGIKNQVENGLYTKSMIPGGFQLETESARATLLNTSGSVVRVQNVSGKATIEINNPGLYLLKLELPGGKTAIEKILIR